MSFFSKLFSSSTAEDERRLGDAHFDAGRFAEARETYDRALDGRDLSPATKEHVTARIAACFDGLAEARIAEAERLTKLGQRSMAEAELRTAMEMARTDAIRARAERLLERGERDDARAQAVELTLTDDDRWAIIAGGWEEAQEDEYDEYGEPFREALLAMDAGDAKTAQVTLEALKREHKDDAVYLWLELARARSRLDDHVGGRKALRRFLDRVPDEDRSEARVNAYAYLAQLAEKDGDEEKAIKELEKGLEAMPDDPRPFLQLGSYLRQKGHAEAAIEVLELGVGLMDEDRPSPAALEELGLAQRAAQREDDAIETLERVIRLFVARAAVADFPPVAASTLAELHEKKGNLARAADLWSSLARGKDRTGHLRYHREAGRVLAKLSMVAEARRMLTRASALAEGQPEIVEAIEAEIAALDDT